MLKNFDDIQKVGKDNMDTAMKSFGSVSKGLQAIASEVAIYSKKSFEEGSAAAEKLLGAKSIEKAIEIQTDYAKSAYESFVAGATRIGAEYARFHSADLTGIKDAMQTSMNFNPPLSFPASFPQSCECDDGTFIACSESCATVGRQGPNRVFMRITAHQAAAPLMSWLGLPHFLSSTTEMRSQ